jgi:hypothetical protein
MGVSTDLLNESKHLLALMLPIRASNCVSDTHTLKSEAQPRPQAGCHDYFQRGRNLHLRCNRLCGQVGKQKAW